MLAGYFRNGFLTGHRPENFPERQLFDLLSDRIRPYADVKHSLMKSAGVFLQPAA
jgi:hypothetical protein